MTRLKPWLILLAVCIGTVLPLTASRTACAQAPAQPVDVVIAAHQKMLAFKSYHVTTDATIAFELKGKTITIVSNHETDFQAEPLLAKNLTTFTADTPNGKREDKLLQYVEATDGQMTIYSFANNKWLKQVLPFVDPRDEYANYFKSIKSVTLLSETAERGTYEVVIDAASLQEDIGKAMAATAGRNIAVTPNLFKDIGDFKYTLTLDKKTGVIASMEYDLSSLLATVGSNAVDAMTLPEAAKDIMRTMFGSMKMEATARISQVNAVGKIVLPPEARSAPLKPEKPQPSQP